MGNDDDRQRPHGHDANQDGAQRTTCSPALQSRSGDFASTRANGIAFNAGHPKSAVIGHARPFHLQSIDAMKRRSIPTRWDQLKPQTGHVPPLPPNKPRSPSVDHFLARVESIVRTWVQEEWAVRETIAAEASKNGWTAQRKTMFAEAALKPENLAQRLDNISISTLRRELKKLDAPTPGAIIRDVRLEYAKHLLTHTRLLIRNVAARAGYHDESHFTELFTKANGITPSQFRRDSIKKTGKV